MSALNSIASVARGIALVAAVAGLSACAAIKDGQVFQEEFWAGGPAVQNTQAELGLAELAKGNYVTAEGHFQRALKSNPKDVHALIGSGLLYQTTGQVTRAREMYEAVLAIRPKESEQFIVWRDLKTRPISEIASVNLALLESGGVLTGLGRGAAGEQPGMASGMAGAGVMGAPLGAAFTGRAPANAMATPGMGGMEPSPAVGELSGPDANVISRFTTLKALQEQGLITAEERAVRRRANVGALLPLTAPPPAKGLDRPVPTTEQISGRLRAIGRALEMRAISVAQHANERAMILDALMPAAPKVVADPALPPQGLLQAADQIRRLEQLREDGFITSDEYARERAAIEAAMQPAPGMPDKKMAAMPADAKAMAQPAADGPGVHLASYRSQKQAERGWSQLRRAHRELLEGLSPTISRVDLGRGKGIYYRLKAGPLADKAAAADLCRKLKRRRQYCEPTILGG